VARTRTTRKRSAPLAPDLPDEFVPAPARLGGHAEWDGVAAGPDFAVDEVVADARLAESVFSGCDFSSRKFTGLQVRDARFEGCDLSGTVLDGATFDRVLLTGCRLTGAMLTGARLQDVVIHDCSARMANFRSTRAGYLVIRDTALVEADFYAAAFTDSAILDCDLTGANVTDLRAGGLALHGSRVDDLVGAASLTGSRIDADQLVPLGAALLNALGIRVTERPG
jgi:uncharacterized protein YjbI with pentapeptide repeats